MDFRRRHKRKSSAMLALMIILLVVIMGIMVLWNPATASARNAQQTSEQSDGIAETIAREGTQAPDFTVTLTDGKQVRLSSLKGRYVILNFWATWCPPCREELKRVQKDIIDRYAGKKVVFIPVNRGEKADAVSRFLAQNGYAFAAGIDTASTIYSLYAEKYIPRNFIISPKGKVLKVIVGYEPEEFDQMLQYIDKLIE